MTDDPRPSTVTAWLARTSAAAYARMSGADEATHCLAGTGAGWEPRDGSERADADFGTAGIQRDLGQLDPAGRLAASAVHAPWRESLPPGPHSGRALLRRDPRAGGEPPGTGTGPRCHREGEHPALRRRPPGIADATGHRAGSPAPASRN